MKFIITNMNDSNTKPVKLLIALFGLVVIILVAIVIPSNPQLFQGQLDPGLSENLENQCRAIQIKTIPERLTANQSGTLLIETNPSDWPGLFTVSASSGTLTDASGHADSLIETNDTIISFSGGDEGSSITVQANDSEICVATLTIGARENETCESVTVSTFPEGAPPNESLEITIQSVPENWTGSYLITADSGRLTLADADTTARGINTSTLVTQLSKVLYNGGTAGETINLQALGEGNETCSATITIGSE